MGKADYALMAEYHRGYEDGRAARAVDEWALQQKRMQVMNKVTKHLQSKLTLYKKLGYSIDNEAVMVNCLGFERSMSPFLHHVISEIVGKDEYSVIDVANGLSELLGIDPNDDCPFVGYDALGRDRADSREPEPAEGVAEEQREKISPPKCMDGKVIHLGDFVVADDCNGHEVMGEVCEIKRCLFLTCWSINISTPAACAIPSECRWFLETQVMRHATHEEKAPIVSSLVQDGIVSDEWAERQLKDESSQYYDTLGNERHKAICELRKLADAIDDGQWVGMYDVGDALGFDIYRTHHNPIRKILQLFVGDEYDDEFYEPRPLNGKSAECCILYEPDKNGDIVSSENIRRLCCDDLLDLLRDAAMDYRSLQQADELRTHVLDAAIEDNKNLRRMAEKLMEPDTPEHIVRDLTLGNISESDAIRRIEKLGEDA